MDERDGAPDALTPAMSRAVAAIAGALSPAIAAELAGQSPLAVPDVALVRESLRQPLRFARLYHAAIAVAVERAADGASDGEIVAAWRIAMANAARVTAWRASRNRAGSWHGAAVFLPGQRRTSEIRSWTIQLRPDTLTHGSAGFHPRDYARARVVEQDARALMRAAQRSNDAYRYRPRRHRVAGHVEGHYTSAGTYIARVARPNRRKSTR